MEHGAGDLPMIEEYFTREPPSIPR